MQDQCPCEGSVPRRPGTPGTATGQPPVARPAAAAVRAGWRPRWPPCLLTGCAAGQRPRARPPRAGQCPRPASRYRAGSQVRVPPPDYARPASVAAAFYVAWASTDAVHDQPGTYLALCAPLVTAALERQLAASQPAPAAWQAMHRARLVSLVRVQAVTHPDGAPAPTPSAVYLRVYATRVTTTSAGRQVASDGVTVQLTRSGGRWLVSAVLFY